MSDRSAAATRALDWLAVERRRFLPPAGSRYDPADTKAVAELGLLIAALRRTGSEGLVGAARLDTLGDTVSAAATGWNAAERPTRASADVVFHAMVCAALPRDRPDHGRHRRLAVTAIAAGVLDHGERLTYHLMEERLLLDWAGIAHQLPSRRTLAERSMLQHPLSALRLTERTTYQLTHDLMFSIGPLPDADGPPDWLDRLTLYTVLSDLIVHFAAARQWDLLGELLLCWNGLQLPDDEAPYDQGWQLLLAQQAEDGSFPGPPRPPSADPDPAAGAERFSHRYHCTLVAVLALVAHERRRPAPLPGRSRRSGRVDVRSVLDPAVAADVSWLAGLASRLPYGSSTAAAACGVLAGGWLAAAIAPRQSGRLQSLLERCAELLAAIDADPPVPPGLALTAYGLLTASGRTAPVLTRTVDLARLALDQTPAGSPARDLWLTEKRVLLDQLGLGPAAPRLPAEDLPRRATIPLDVSVEQLRVVALLAESATAYGTVDPPLTAGAVEVSRTLAAHAGRLLAAGDVPTACALLRAAHHLGPMPPERCSEFAAALLVLQRHGGGYALPLALGGVPGTGLEAFDPDLELRLPLTLTVLWTLAELIGDFRLYRSIRAREPAVPTTTRPDGGR